jgi:hypothetical protein
VDDVVTRRFVALMSRAIALVAIASGAAAAQTTGPAPPQDASRLWIVAGGGSTTILGDCTDCEDQTYIHTGSVLGVVGRSLTPRTDAGVEVMWVPATASTGDKVRTTFVMGAFQFRPWRSKGFFLTFDVGMAFVRNWIVDVDRSEEGFTSKAFALALGGGWEWRLTPRFGAQVYGAQHVSALGDLTGNQGTFDNVVGNFWTVGAGIVIR